MWLNNTLKGERRQSSKVIRDRELKFKSTLLIVFLFCSRSYPQSFSILLGCFVYNGICYSNQPRMLWGFASALLPDIVPGEQSLCNSMSGRLCHVKRRIETKIEKENAYSETQQYPNEIIVMIATSPFSPTLKRLETISTSIHCILMSFYFWPFLSRIRIFCEIEHSFKISIFHFSYSDFNRIKFRKAEPSDFFETLYIYVF